MSRARTRAPTCDRQAIWAALRTIATGDCAISAPAIRRQMHGACPPGRIRDYLRGLEAAGILVRVEPTLDARRPIAQPTYYRLADDRGAEAPRVRADGTEVPPTVRERIWTALRVMGSGTLAEIRATVQDGAERVPLSTIADYLGRLERAGLVFSVMGGRPELRRYHLARAANTGPLAPVIQGGRDRRSSTVLDPNTGRVRGMDGQEVMA